MKDWRDLKRMMKALSDIARLTIVYHLAHQEQEITVNSLTDLLHISQPLVSWHLRRLRRAGLVETQRIGRQVYCSLNRERFQQCLHALEGLANPTIHIESPPIGAALMEVDTAVEE
jgi:ArsR family transcriptional regulator